MGLLGHSDADCPTHALMDAILGALAMGDIGKLFPDTSPEYKGISSMVLLSECVRRMDESGYEIGNADITIVAQKPRISPYTEDMRRNLAEYLKCDMSRVSVKATTEEKLGFTGEMLGMKCYAVVLLNEK
jgi:2-C-methyl-D-erythritol 2,4-cyclodiphosphate synthase